MEIKKIDVGTNCDRKDELQPGLEAVCVFLSVFRAPAVVGAIHSGTVRRVQVSAVETSNA